MDEERVGLVTFQGHPMTLLGPPLIPGRSVPAFRLVDNQLRPITLADSAGRIRLITAVPSLDTGVCDTMTRTFNQQAARLPDEVAVYTVSLDLPFAQARWCGNAGIERVITLSDYRERSFGLGYGLLIKELMLLARAVLVVDRDDTLRYFELVPEVTDEPDYRAALDAVKQLL